jgi:4-hydroxybenzoate polyprenyltransferase
VTSFDVARPPQLSSKLRPFFALSRTPHGLLDMAAAALAALLCLGHFPALGTTLIGIVTVFAGYTTVYALNDLVDYRSDKRKVDTGTLTQQAAYADLDSMLLRHPLATGALSLPAALVWTAAWAVIAISGAYWLNPACLIIFLLGCLLESLYCLLWRVTPLRTLINGAVKTLGPVAAVFAVNPQPPVVFTGLLFLWIFAWEIGGQNIPNDWTDIEEDRRFSAQTIPVKLGPRRAELLSVAALAMALFLNIALLWASPISFPPLMLLAAVVANIYLLLWPALDMAESRSRREAMALFNKASYYPLAILGLVLIRMLL